jgi:hypothetical protein
VIAGAVFMLAEMLMVWLFMGESPWAPPRMMAALAVHFPLSIVYGLIVGWMVHRMDMAMALLASAAFGLIAIYFVNFYAIAPAAFRRFVEARNWISAFAHALFGAVAAASYVLLRKPREPKAAAA